MVANTFGAFLNLRASDLPPLPGLSDYWPALTVELEQCCRFPWTGGEHPWLDVLVATPTHLIGVESKRYEPFRARKAVNFSSAYLRDVWGDEMKPFEDVRDRLTNGTLSYLHLDAEQLVKHAFGLRTEAGKRGKSPVLLYLYAEPHAWPDGRAILTSMAKLHADEIESFARGVAGAEVRFVSCSYRQLLATFGASPSPDIRDHGMAITHRFSI